MTEHDLKSWPEFFGPILSGAKTFELRKNDRGYKVGDLLRLREYEPVIGEWDNRHGAGTYTGREIVKRVSYIMDGVGTGGIAPLKGLASGYCILGLMDSK